MPNMPRPSLGTLRFAQPTRATELTSFTIDTLDSRRHGGTPTQRINTLFHPTHKGAVRPFPHRITMAMLYGVVMDVIHMPAPILFIPYRMLPKAPLPYRPFPLAFPRCRRWGGNANTTRAEISLDAAPARRIIIVSLRQAPQRMQMIRKNYDRIDLERVFFPFPPECVAQAFDIFRHRQQGLAFVCHDGEKIPTACNP